MRRLVYCIAYLVFLVAFVTLLRGFGQLEDDLLPTQFDVHQPPRLQLGNAAITGYPGSSLDRIEILWQTNSPAGDGQDSFVVEYRLSGTNDAWQTGGVVSRVHTGVGTRIIHSSSITGLNWDTDYEYRVQHVHNGIPIKAWKNGFHTRLLAGDSSPFSFAAYGDSASAASIANFNLVQSQINAGPVAFSLLLGDMAYEDGTHVEYDARFDPKIAPPAAKWNAAHVDFPGIGNHELHTDSGQPTEENFAVPIPVAGINAPAAPPESERREHNYSFDYGDVHFVTFDTTCLNNAERLDGLLDWAVADLNASTAKWKLVFGHHAMAGTPNKPESLVGNYFQQVISRLGPSGAGVDLFVVGHSHTYSWTYPLTGKLTQRAAFVNDPDKDYTKGAGLVQVVSGVGGKSLRPGDYSQFPFVASGYTTTTATPVEFGYTLIEVTPDQITVKYIAADDGAVIDRLTITDSID